MRRRVHFCLKKATQSQKRQKTVQKQNKTKQTKTKGDFKQLLKRGKEHPFGCDYRTQKKSRTGPAMFTIIDNVKQYLASYILLVIRT